MFWESLKMAVSSLLANKMRALLTMLGIIVGIASVIAIVSLGEGGKNEVLGQFDQIGAATVMVSVRSSAAQASDYITESDLEAIRGRSDLIKHVTASLQTIASAASEEKKSRIYLAAIDAEYTSFSDIDLVHGRLFTEIEYTDGRASVIIDKTGANNLFGRENAVGETMTLQDSGKLLHVTVIGVCESVTSQMTSLMASYGMDTGDTSRIPFFVYLPIKSAQKLIGETTQLSTISIMATSAENADDAAAAVVRQLEMRHGNSGRDIYRTQNMASILDQINNVINILTVFISAVAAISLLVGGIGVMNIMLVSVTERTHEIGIRMAIGARGRDILVQFLIEAVVLSLSGGLIGVLIGFLATWIVNMATDWITVISPTNVLLSFGFAGAVGIFFGYYPARKAAALNPIEALRYE